MSLRIVCFIFAIILMSYNSFSDDLFISRTRSLSEVDRNLLYDYKSRLESRRISALSKRREIYSGKVHVYPLSIPMNYGNIGLNNFPIRQNVYRSYSSGYFFNNYRHSY